MTVREKYHLEQEKRAIKRDQRMQKQKLDLFSAKYKLQSTENTSSVGDFLQDMHHNNLESLDEAIKAIKLADDTADDTLNQLERQGEQLRNIDSGLYDINSTLKSSDRILKGMASFGGRVSNYFSKEKPAEDTRFNTLKSTGKVKTYKSSPPIIDDNHLSSSSFINKKT